MKTKQQIVSLLTTHLDLERKGFHHFPKAIDQDGNYYIKELAVVKQVLYFNLMKRNFLHGLGGWLYIKPIEDLLQPLLIKYGFLQSIEKDERTLIRPIITSDRSIKILNEAQETSLDTNVGITKVGDLIWEYLEQVYVPFWEKYADLQVVNDEIIDKVPDTQITDYIPSYASFKKVILMKLCNNPKYEQYRDWLYGGLKKRYEEGNNQNYYMLLLDLMKLLDK